jgi:hypothetical protein
MLSLQSEGNADSTAIARPTGDSRLFASETRRATICFSLFTESWDFVSEEHNLIMMLNELVLTTRL